MSEFHGVEDYWFHMSIENKQKFLSIQNFWKGFDIYLWEYLPEILKDSITEDFERLDAKPPF